MPRRRISPSTLALGGACVLAALLGGCKAKIGDACRVSTNCSIRGDRVCDLSHRIDGAGNPTPSGSGECTVESCGFDDCPKEAECVKVYGSDFLTVACDPRREDKATSRPGMCDLDTCIDEDTAGPAQPDCLEDGDECVYAPLDACAPNEVCLPEGLCADEITARTSCRRRCKQDDDCRTGYECVRTGARGIYAAPDPDHPGKVTEVKICVPKSE
ncbi:MAG: hypothetical protein K1X88_13855 [Nannocystaceae bacterium]|nr:hypothetical protein [Nannocystaceae bacterium]